MGLGLTIDKVLEVAALQENDDRRRRESDRSHPQHRVFSDVTNEILENVPSSRDLWNTVQQVPGVVMIPRENVGGFDARLGADVGARLRRPPSSTT